jgi:hypothetical protein
MSIYTSKTIEERATEQEAYNEAWTIVENYSNNQTTLVEIIKNLILAAKENN